MNNMIKLSEKGLREIQEIVSSPIFNVVRRSAEVREWRNETTADWIANFMATMERRNESSKPEYEVDLKTGEIHNVESMVADLRERVKLDAIQKGASLNEIPLSKKMVVEAASKKKDQDEEKYLIQQFIEDHYSSHRGHADSPAIIYACRDKFGFDQVADNLKFIEKIIEESREKFRSPNLLSILPSAFQGQPMKADPQGDSLTPIFENIKNI